MDKKFKFDIFGECFSFGNREDRQHGDGRPEEEDWYSWEAREIDYDPLVEGYDAAIIKVYGEGIETQEHVVLWKRIYE